MGFDFSEEQIRQFRLKNEFLLDENNVPYPCEDLLNWGMGMEELRISGQFRVAEELVNDIWISTVFLGINHSMGSITGRDDTPVLFETMVFDQSNKDRGYDIDMDRYCTWAEAEKGHKAIVEMVKMAEEIDEGEKWKTKKTN